MHITNIKFSAQALTLTLALAGTHLACSDTPASSPDAGIPAGATGSFALGTCENAFYPELWVPRQAANDIKIIAGVSFTIRPDPMGTINLAPTGLVGPHLLSFNADGSKAVVAMLGTPDMMYANGGVVIIDAVTLAILNTISTGRKTHHAIFLPDGNVVAANVNSEADMPGSVSFIDVAGGTVTKRLDVGGQAVALTLSADGTKAYLTNQAVEAEKSKLLVIDMATKELDGTPYLTSKQTVSVRLNSEGNVLYVTNGMGENVEKINLENTDRTLAISTFAEGLPDAHGLALTKDHLIVGARGGARVSIYDSQGVLAKDIPITATTGNPLVDWVAISPNCTKAYVTERTDGKVLQIDMMTMAITGSVDVTQGSAMHNPHGISVRKGVDPDM